MTRKLLGCVAIKCSNTHFDILECACLACGSAEHLVLSGLPFKSGIMVFALSQSVYGAGESEGRVLRCGNSGSDKEAQRWLQAEGR